jgi:DNA-binding MarR family transcriptional regulator
MAMAKRPAAQEVSLQQPGTGTAGPLEDAWRIFDARHLPYRALMLGKMLDRLTAQQVREHAGLSLAEWRVLVHIAVMGPKSASEVSAAALVDRAEVSRAVRALEANGYLNRANNPRNRKSSLLTLTPEGVAVYDSLHVQRRAFFEALTAGFTPDALAMLDGLLLRMARNADRIAQQRASSG